MSESTPKESNADAKNRKHLILLSPTTKHGETLPKSVKQAWQLENDHPGSDDPNIGRDPPSVTDAQGFILFADHDVLIG